MGLFPPTPTGKHCLELHAERMSEGEKPLKSTENIGIPGLPRLYPARRYVVKIL